MSTIPAATKSGLLAVAGFAGGALMGAGLLRLFGQHLMNGDALAIAATGLGAGVGLALVRRHAARRAVTKDQP